jgi:ADP-ribosyl-[dinitrogen reductase] hydrolase
VATARDAVRDRYRGSLIGLTVGNTLGLPVESWPRSAILERFPHGVREIDAAERRLPWDDDAAQAVILAESILEHDTVRAADLAERFVVWARTSGRGIGALTAEVIRVLRDGAPPASAARSVWERDGGQPAGNGAVMRCAPVAMRWPREADRGTLLEETERSSLVTHYDPRCVWSSYAVNLVLAAALEGRRASVREVEEELSRAGAEPQVLHAVHEVAGHDLDHFRLDGSAIGFTLKAMQVGLWCLERGGDFEESIVSVIGAGGDTDTNAAVAGALLGALHGARSIPQRWVASIADPNRITSLADRLLERAGI